jgi:hypothetical protein
MEIPMVQQDPPVKSYRPSKQNREMVNARREQLHANAGVWFVWQDDARNRAYERKMLWLLLGLRQGEKFSKNEIDYQSRIVETENGRFTLYVRYHPVGTMSQPPAILNFSN